MKLKTLESALNCSIAGTNEPNHLEALLKARDEIIALANHCEDGLDTDVTVVSWYAFNNLMNIATYDDFGRLEKMAIDPTKLSKSLLLLYRNACRNLICEELTDAQTDGVADFLCDLWNDNEAYGANNPDGTFAEDTIATKDKRINELGDIINKLYHHRGLGPDDIMAIEQYIY